MMVMTRVAPMPSRRVLLTQRSWKAFRVASVITGMSTALETSWSQMGPGGIGSASSPFRPFTGAVAYETGIPPLSQLTAGNE